MLGAVLPAALYVFVNVYELFIVWIRSTFIYTNNCLLKPDFQSLSHKKAILMGRVNEIIDMIVCYSSFKLPLVFILCCGCICALISIQRGSE